MSRPSPRAEVSGFTLLELLLVVALLGLAASALVVLVSHLFVGRTAGVEAAVAARAQESCADTILGQRRAGAAYASVVPGLCSAWPSVSVALKNASGQPVSSCAGSVSCTITIATAGVQPLTIRLWDY